MARTLQLIIQMCILDSKQFGKGFESHETFLRLGLFHLIYYDTFQGCYMVAYVTAAENTLPSHTVTFVTVVGSGFVMGELVLSLEAYLIRDWKTLQVPMLLKIVADIETTTVHIISLLIIMTILITINTCDITDNDIDYN